MKILAITGTPEDKNVNAVELWRVYRPLQELARHVDWQIDFQPCVIRDKTLADTPEAFLRDHAEAEARHISQYDIVFSSYYTDPTETAVLWGAQQLSGTKTVIDVDDNLYDIDPLNPVLLKIGDATSYDGAYFVRKIVQQAQFITTTNKALATLLKNTSAVAPKTYVIPNFIADEYRHGPISNGDAVVIGYFGSSSHYQDLHETGLLPALQRIMHDHKQTRFVVVGQPIDEYLPRRRTATVDIVPPYQWTSSLFPSLSFDIGLAPLIDSAFNRCKSDIKWQEYTRMGAAVIASNVGPYQTLPAGTVTTVNNTEADWYHALDKLLSVRRRQKQLKTATIALESYRLEDNWTHYKAMFEDVARTTV